MPVTRRQREILDYITKHLDDKGYAPSFEGMEAQLTGDLLEAGSIPLVTEVLGDVVEDLALATRDRHAGSRRFTEP